VPSQARPLATRRVCCPALGSRWAAAAALPISLPRGGRSRRRPSCCSSQEWPWRRRRARGRGVWRPEPRGWATGQARGSRRAGAGAAPPAWSKRWRAPNWDHARQRCPQTRLRARLPAPLPKPVGKRAARRALATRAGVSSRPGPRRGRHEAIHRSRVAHSRRR
jgi:hypothetical protein